jgi:aryl-alcohol dehydrogenase-like predicted oxidoreductase
MSYKVSDKLSTCPFDKQGLMNYRSLGRTGDCFHSAWALQTRRRHLEADSIEIIHAALDAGINPIDTDVYNDGQSEIIVGASAVARGSWRPRLA